MLGVVRYCNAIPIWGAFKEDARLSLVCDTPPQLYRSLKSRTLIAALTSSYHLLDPQLFSFSPFCIAAHQKVLSVTFYHKGSISSLNGMRIALTDESNSSAALLRLLCHLHWKISPIFEIVDNQKPLQEYAGFLWIGDRALEHQTIKGYQSVDLATAWYEMTALPFVFALFLADVQEKENPLLSEIEDRIESSLRLGISQIEQTAARVAIEKKLPLSLMREYYGLLRYRLDAEERCGLTQFITLYKAYQNDLLQRRT